MPKAPMLGPTRLVNRNVFTDRGRTSMRLEPELWGIWSELCEWFGLSQQESIRQAMTQLPGSGRTSAVRVWIVRRLDEQAKIARQNIDTEFSAAQRSARTIGGG